MELTESDEGSDYEDEILVVELTGVPNPDAVLQSKGPCSVLGLDTAEPVLQLENYVFKGRYQESLGTSLLFRENGELKYVCETTKKLSMSRVVLRKKATNGSTGDGGGDSENHEPTIPTK